MRRRTIDSSPLERRLAAAQRFQQLRFNLNLRPVVLQFGALNQEGVVNPFTQGGYLGELQVDVVFGQDTGHAVEQADAVAG